MQNVSESRGICHTADFICALYQMNEDRENGVINLKIVKNRLGGMVGKHAMFKLDPESLNLADITFDNNFSSTVENSEMNDVLKTLNSKDDFLDI